MDNYQIVIKKPVITEKSIYDAGRGIFTFEVGKDFNKAEIKKAIEKEFSVHVVSITSVTLKGKERRSGRARKLVRQPDRKKVRVRLKSGEKIPLFELGQNK